MKFSIAEINFDQQGLIPAIVQDANTRQVLTLAYMNRASLERSLETGETWFWSRSRSRLWHKGETSGNTQRLVDVALDCDADALRILVVPNGPACHTGAQSCFHNQLEAAPQAAVTTGQAYLYLGEILEALYAVVESRKRERPAGSYSTYLFDEGLDKILKKVGEESAETIIAAKNADPNALVREASDLLYHLIVLFVQRGVTLEQVRAELAARRK